MSGKILKEVFETKLLFKQRLFSWFDSYDIYDETEQTVYVVKGQLAFEGAFSYDGHLRDGYRESGRCIICADVCSGDRCREVFKKLN